MKIEIENVSKLYSLLKESSLKNQCSRYRELTQLDCNLSTSGPDCSKLTTSLVNV